MGEQRPKWDLRSPAGIFGSPAGNLRFPAGFFACPLESSLARWILRLPAGIFALLDSSDFRQRSGQSFGRNLDRLIKFLHKSGSPSSLRREMRMCRMQTCVRLYRPLFQKSSLSHLLQLLRAADWSALTQKRYS